MKKYLCYIEGNLAYFTDNMEKQWGSSWNDELDEDNEKEDYENDTEIETVIFSTHFSMPTGIDGHYSLLPMQDINEKGIPWLAGTSYKTGEHIQIFSGTELSEFINVITKHGGEIF